ncbi:MAG: ABC transporter permease subunit [Candidatus Lokiarchaeota archaeon]|nr:ABC transporter permease subunit [Candidatus Lokiarchaeota archaeon]
MESFLEFMSLRWQDLILRTGEHVFLTFISSATAVIIGVPLGIIAFRVKKLQNYIMSMVGVLQTIPSLALLVIMLTLIGQIGSAPAIASLILYALLPIVRNTLTGLQEVPASLIEAADGLGMTQNQALFRIRLPLAVPVIVSGVRTAAVISVGIATLTAFVGAGGLGQFIIRGLALTNNKLILLGAIPAALLALLIDFTVATVQKRFLSKKKKENRATVIITFALIALLIGVAIFSQLRFWGNDYIRIGSKKFSEQNILGEMMAQMIEHNLDIRVDKRFNLGGTMVCHNAIKGGQIDIYPEYTGTALTAILGFEKVPRELDTFKYISEEYREKFNLIWLRPFGFNNTYVITTTKEKAEKYNWETFSDLEPYADELKAGFPSEFMERPDGYPGFVNAYGFRFGEVYDMEQALMYRAAKKGTVDVISAYITDGRIIAFDLKPLVDNRDFFPDYFAAPVVREATLDKYPEITEILNSLAGKLDNKTMRQLNYRVDGLKEDPAKVARDFLEKNDLLE